MPPTLGGSERVGNGLSQWRLRRRDILLTRIFFVLVDFVNGGEESLKGRRGEVGSRLVPVRPEEVTPTP